MRYQIYYHAPTREYHVIQWDSDVSSYWFFHSAHETFEIAELVKEALEYREA